jgi:hypothetical protein
MPFRTPVFKTGAIAILPALRSQNPLKIPQDSKRVQSSAKDWVEKRGPGKHCGRGKRGVAYVTNGLGEALS